MINKLFSGTKVVLKGTGSALSGGLGSIKSHPQILIYPYLAAVFILLTFPIVNGLVFQVWNAISPDSILSEIDATPRYLKILVGLVAFSVFYTIFVTAYFTTAISAGVAASLDGKKVSAIYGLQQVARNFLRVSMFAILAIFFFPLSLLAQRHKLLSRKLPGVIGSSLSLNMAQLAPTILSEKKGLMDTIRHSVDTLGKSWRENLIIKVGTWAIIFALLSAGFLPSLIAENWIDADTAQLVGALTAILLSFAAYVVTRVTGSVFTATLYHQASQKKSKSK